MLREEAPSILAADGDGAPADGAAATATQGGRERGTILHKLIEEVLTGETAEEKKAIAFGSDGAPQVVIDWKSDVDPSPETLEHYRAQVRAYLDMTGADRGLIVAVTSDSIMQVAQCTDG